MESMDSPFDAADRILAEGVPKITLVDFHAEATGEKKSLAYYLDGRVSAVFGTHTHVQMRTNVFLSTVPVISLTLA